MLSKEGPYCFKRGYPSLSQKRVKSLLSKEGPIFQKRSHRNSFSKEGNCFQKRTHFIILFAYIKFMKEKKILRSLFRF